MSGSATLVSRNYSPGDEFPVGSTIVKYVFSDESGNQASCIFTVIISTNDTTPPDITCVDDIFETIGLGTRGVRVHFTQPSATDISGNATLIFKNYDPGDEFPVGSTGVTYVFVDGSGNQATCNFTVAIDTEISNSSLGLENGNIPDSSLTASSFWGNNSPCSPKMARLHIKRIDGTSVCGSWSSGVVDSNQWIQVDLLTLYRIHGVATQGREDWTQWVTSYKINCSKDGLIFDTVKEFTTKTTNQLTDKVFVGNYDHSTVVYNAFPEPIVCRYVRLLPMSWYHHISLRMELYGDSPVQDPEWHCISRKCYRLDTGEKSWKDARNYCHSLSAVITITGPKEPSLLFADTTEKLPPLLAPIFIDKFSIWINCNDKQEEGNFTCDIDGQGTKEGKQSWAPGEPNGDPDQITGKDEDCAAVSINPQDWVVRGWYDIICSTLYSNTICQIRLY
ncbi:uncharacterized protein LOC121423208 [Lytechinus variegatus]|uniref:uncharacterized protein LOC121423208 n=1 Tax=Lytechinus variegatus TaxID=7654 RepID=UPI001BB2BE09|nr:uncharacterized protein LOC121423208 [Lytechinus variegatus]